MGAGGWVGKGQGLRPRAKVMGQRERGGLGMLRAPTFLLCLLRSQGLGMVGLTT